MDSKFDRESLLRLALKLQGIPYIWGGATVQGFDCSGFVVWLFQVFGLLPSGDWTANGLSKTFPQDTANPQPGDLVFFGPDPSAITHVMVYAGEFNGERQVVGASGGGSKTTTVEIANAIGAKVKMKPLNYRRDFQRMATADVVRL
jgi:cell wall-associated NlpC family hydrolase